MIRLTIRERIAAAESKPIVSAAELALLIGVSVDTIRRAGDAGEIPRLRVGRTVRYPREDAMHAMRRRGSETAGDRRSTQAQREPADA